MGDLWCFPLNSVCKGCVCVEHLKRCKTSHSFVFLPYQVDFPLAVLHALYILNTGTVLPISNLEFVFDF